MLFLYTFMAWTGTNLLFLNINYNTVTFTVCWITEQWDLIFTGIRGFFLLQNMQTLGMGGSLPAGWKWG